MSRLCILTGSPRVGGNSDTAAQAAAEEAARCGMEPDLIHLRDHHVRPCVACDFCQRHAGTCRLDKVDGGDDAGRLFTRMAAADVLLLAAPVYFYGPPAGLKALIDRAQRFWSTNKPLPEADRTPTAALLVLCAARTSGDRLFDASLLILRCFLRAINRELHSPLLLRGLDGAQDLQHRPDLVCQAKALGRKAASICGGSTAL